MLFKILKFALIFVLPFAIYLAWAFFARRREAEGKEQFQDTPWIWLSMAGMVLMIIAILSTAFWTERLPPTDLGKKTTQVQ
jgi:cytochrome bd-type quinol oxidase subunit 2